MLSSYCSNARMCGLLRFLHFHCCCCYIGLLRSIQLFYSYHSFYHYPLNIYNKYHHSPVTTAIHPPCTTSYTPELFLLLPRNFKFIPDFLYIFSSAIFVLPSSMKPIVSVLHSNSGLPTAQWTTLNIEIYYCSFSLRVSNGAS